MKQAVLFTITAVVLLLLSGCINSSGRSPVTGSITMTSLTSDTLSVTRDNSVVYRFEMTSSPMIDINYEWIDAQIYSGVNLMPVEYITANVVSHAISFSTATVDVVVSAGKQCDPATYDLRVTTKNSATVETKNVTIIVE